MCYASSLVSAYGKQDLTTKVCRTSRVAAPRRAQRCLGWLACWLWLAGWLTSPGGARGAFGVTSSGGYYIVDSGAGLVFKVSQASGDITSIQFNGVEYQATDKNSQLISGLGSATVTATNYGGVIEIAIATSAVNTIVSNLTHYLMVRNGSNIIYMATYAAAEPSVGELRWITRLQSSRLSNGPVPSDIRNNAACLENCASGGDVFELADGTTRSKYYGDSATHGKDREIDLSYCGATGSGVGVWMVYGNREGSSGGPFFRDIQNQCGTDQEIYNYINSGHNQTEAYRTNVLHGPYALVFTSGAPPTLSLDSSWIDTAGLNLLGWLPATNRGAVTGVAYGIPAGFQAVVGFANTNAQYWAVVPSNGAYATPLMKPGTYAVTLYKGELAVAANSVTVGAGRTNTLNLASTETMPSAILKIGEWDGTPASFLNADKLITMHPSDARMSNWGPVTFTVGSDPVGNFPAASWKLANNTTTVLFNLSAGQIANLTLRVGITCAYAGGRPKPSINAWSPSNPSPSSQPSSRSLTIGTYRGNNWLYTWTVPASAFVVGQNTLQLTVISGSGTTNDPPFLSPGCAYDAVELDGPNTAPAPPGAPSGLNAVFATSRQVNLTWTDNSTNEVNILIERSPDNVNFTLIGAVTAGVTNFVDTGFAPGGMNFYRVQASNSGGKSAYSNFAGAVPPALAAVAVSDTTLTLSAGGGAPGAAWYLISTTDLNLPSAQWTRVATNTFDAFGISSLTIPLGSNGPGQFFRLQLP